MFLKTWVVVLICAFSACANASSATNSAPIAPDVQLLPGKVFQPTPKDARTRRLLREIHESILLWNEVLLQHSKIVPGKAGMRYYGEGGNLENDIRPIAYGALVNAFLAKVDSSKVSPQRRARMQEETIALLRYLTSSHLTGKGTCVNGKQWGNHWQSTMWTRSASLAGWMLWAELPPELQESVARMTAHEADRFLKTQPKSSVRNDTGAEENAWNAQILSLACCMMPKHPQAPAWNNAARLWCYNSLSVENDASDSRPGDDGKPIRDWVKTVNVHSDFTMENHGLVHIGYLKTSISLLLENTTPYWLVGAPPPLACQHHAQDCFQVLLQCMAWDASPIYFSGNDWKMSHTQATDTMMYSLMSVLTGDRNAAYLEEVGLKYLRRIQDSRHGFYNERTDLESGGLCSTRLIAAWIAHATQGAGAQPATAAEFDRSVSGVRFFPKGSTLVHRTPTKFASFTWSQKRMALSYPADGSWVIWPHFASGLGLINGQDASSRFAQLRSVHYDFSSNSFSVCGALDRAKGAVQHAFFFASPAGNFTVYIEQLRSSKVMSLKSRETGLIGLEYPLAKNEQTLTGTHGKTRVVGVGGEKPRVVEWETDWLNLADKVGFVVRRFPPRQNVMRYHDETNGTGRIPKLEEWISLIGERQSESLQPDGDWACLVAFHNQRASVTRRSVAKVSFAAQGQVAVCRVGEEQFVFDLKELSQK